MRKTSGWKTTRCAARGVSNYGTLNGRPDLWRFAVGAATALLVPLGGLGCNEGDTGTEGDISAVESLVECESPVLDADCDDTLRPIVFIHGTFGSATEISKTALRFGSNGFCQDRFVAVEYNSLGGDPLAELTALVDDVLERTGFDQVDLAGHSQGTGHACTYLSDEDNRAKVAHYLNISGGCAGHGVPTLSLSSENDLRGGPVHSSGEMVEQVTLVDEDHVALAGSKKAFEAMYSYLRGGAPARTDIACGDEMVTLSGKVVSFGDNVPQAGVTVDAFEVDAYADTPYERGEPSFTWVADDDGQIEGQVRRGVRYEFRATFEDGETAGYTYPGPARRSNYLTRVLLPAQNPVIESISSGQVNRAEGHSAFTIRYIGGALRADWNNSLVIDGEEVLSEENAGRNASVVGLFAYDANENGESDRGEVFSSSFLYGTDFFVDSTEPRWLPIEWTNEDGESTELRVPNWPSSETMFSLQLP